MIAELRSMNAIARALAKLNPPARHRALTWAWDKFLGEPGRAVDAMVDGLRVVSRPYWQPKTVARIGKAWTR